MRPDQVTSWYRRMSFVYAIGAWSVLGSAIFLTRNQKASGGVEQMDGSRNETPVSASDDFEPVEGLYVTTYVKYSENCVPVTQRILDYLKSWTGGPGPKP